MLLALPRPHAPVISSRLLGCPSPQMMALLPQKGMSILVPLGSPQGATAKKVADGAGGRKLGIPGVENHAEVFGDDGRLSAILHLQQGRGGDVRGAAAWEPSGSFPPLVPSHFHCWGPTGPLSTRLNPAPH